MAIADVAEYAHLSDADLEALGCELEAIRRDIEDSRSDKGRAYIQRAIAFQRCLELPHDSLSVPAAARPAGCSEPPRSPWPRASRTWNSAITSATIDGIGGTTRKSIPAPGSGTWPVSPRSNGIPTTTATTCSPPSSGWTTSDPVCCGSPATSSGGSLTCCSLCETCCWPSCSNGASRCRACTRRIIGQRQTPRKPPRPEA